MPKRKKVTTSSFDVFYMEHQREKKKLDRLRKEMEQHRNKVLHEANEDDDKIIKKLEKQLGLNKVKNKMRYFADDGLDYLLELCDKTTSEKIVASEKHLASVEAESDFEEDLAAVTGKEIKDENCTRKVKKNKKDIPDTNDSSDEEDNEDDDVESDNEDDEMGDDISESGDVNYSSDDEPEEIPTKRRKTIDKCKSSDTKKKDKGDVQSKVQKEIKSKKNKIMSEEEFRKEISEDEVSHLSGDDEDLSGDNNDMLSASDADDADDSDENKSDVKEKKDKPVIWEDIYGRKRDKEGNILKEEKGKYVPPHLRNKDSTSGKELIQLKRQIKSVLNKVSGTNLHWACNTLENLYCSNSQNSVNTAFSDLWSEALVAPSLTPDRLVCEHAALLAIAHANRGEHIGAHFLQVLVEKFDEMTRTPQPQEDKRLDNLVLCLSYMYSFKMFNSSLLYDILARLIENICEKNIDCVLVALRSAGGTLRKDDPLALKKFIQDTQAKLSENGSLAKKSRSKFLLEVLMALKNNNLQKIPNYDPSYCQHLTKQIRAVIRKGNYITPLNISLEDLLKVEERGKWWVVGSAWEGNVDKAVEVKKAEPAYDSKLLEAARQQRMNTDIRRSIFCVIMSAEDYLDAFEKLQQLGLRGQQEREIVYVLFSCCLQENPYNPYYAVLAQKLCDTDRKYMLAIKFSVWDKIKEIEKCSKQTIHNMGQLIIHLLMGQGLPISVLKVIEFSDLNKMLMRFMRQILLAVIMNKDQQASLEVFTRVAKSENLKAFRERLKLFIQHFLIRNTSKKTAILSEEEMETLRKRVLLVEKIL